MIVRSSAPLIAAAVTSPDRREWAEKSRGRLEIGEQMGRTPAGMIGA
jgi:hypothetical protein